MWCVCSLQDRPRFLSIIDHDDFMIGPENLLQDLLEEIVVFSNEQFHALPRFLGGSVNIAGLRAPNLCSPQGKRGRQAHDAVPIASWNLARALPLTAFEDLSPDVHKWLVCMSLSAGCSSPQISRAWLAASGCLLRGSVFIYETTIVLELVTPCA